MATIVYQFEEKIKTEGITDLTLFTEKIDFDAEEPNLIVEEDSTVLEDTAPAVNYKEVMLDFEARRFLSKPDLAIVLIRGITLAWRTQFMVNICRNISNHGHTADSIHNVYTVQILWSEIPVSKSELNIGKAFTNQQSN